MKIVNIDEIHEMIEQVKTINEENYKLYKSIHQNKQNLYIVSFPRSGQHMTECILSTLLPKHNIHYSYCPYYHCCNKIPCEKGFNIQKHHDVDNTLDILDSNKYLVLYRDDLILNIESYYRHIINYELNPDKYSYDDLIDFFRNKIEYYKNFKNKWVNVNKTNVLQIEYYDYIKNPKKNILSILMHFYPEIKIDDDKIDNLIDNGFLNYDIKKFRHDKINDKIGLKHFMDEKYYNKIKDDLIKNNLI